MRASVSSRSIISSSATRCVISHSSESIIKVRSRPDSTAAMPAWDTAAVVRKISEA